MESDSSMRIVGVDVSKDSLDVAVEGSSSKRFYERKVSNDAGGFKRLLEDGSGGSRGKGTP